MRILMNNTLQSKFYEQLEKEPKRNALAFVNSRCEFSWRSLEEVYRKAIRYGAALKEQGLKQGDVCIFVLPSDEYSATLLIASLLVGARPLLIAPPTIQMQARYSNLKEVLKRITLKTKAKIVIADKEMSDMREELEHNLKETRFVFEESYFDQNSSAAELPLTIPKETDTAAMQLTSGTTGFPRICVWKQKSVIAALDGMELAMELNKEDICLNWTPLYHDMGLVNNFLLCLIKGLPLVMINPLDFVKKPALWLQSLSKTKATITWSPNFGYAISTQRIRDEEVEDVSLAKVRAFWNAAERIHFETIEIFYKRFAHLGLAKDALKTNFGCAENVGGATFSDPCGSFVVEQVDDGLLQKKGVAYPVTEARDGQRMTQIVGVGRPCPGIQIKILSPKGRYLPDGHVGEVILKTPSRMAGYLNDAKENRKALYGEWLRTGDLGYKRGQELFWVGRLRERINKLGKKFDPSDFEQILLNISDLRPGCFSAFGVDDIEQGTQKIVIVSEVQNFVSQDLSQVIEEIQSQIYQRLGVKVDEIILVEKGTLTKTSSGKRRHRHFRNLYLSGELKLLDITKKAFIKAS